MPNLVPHIKGRTLADGLMRETFVRQRKAAIGNRRWAHNEECHGVYCLPGITRYC